MPCNTGDFYRLAHLNLLVFTEFCEHFDSMKKAGTFVHSPSLSMHRLPRRIHIATATAFLAVAVATALAVAPEEQSVQQLEISESLLLSGLQPLGRSDQIYFTETEIERGDTLPQLLARLNVHDETARKLLSSSPDTHALREQFIAGREISARTNASGRLEYLYFRLDDRESALVVERQGNELNARTVAERPEIYTITKTAEIQHSMFGASDAAGIPDSIAIQIAELFGGEIDFHSDLRKGDRFTVSYEMRYLNGQPTRSGKILAVEFINAGSTYQAVWFDRDGAPGEYLTPEGRSLKKAFLRSPIEFSRVSSGFSMRFHPILKQWRAHKGVDYAAPSGTRIRATGDATVEFVGNQKGYGKTIVLKHDTKHSTLYAHLSRFNSNISKGKRVKQGEIIGFVGQTGWATGPHLHYEFRLNNTPVNPLSVKLPFASPALSKTEKKLFEAQASTRIELLNRLKHTQVAHLE